MVTNKTRPSTNMHNNWCIDVFILTDMKRTRVRVRSLCWLWNIRIQGFLELSGVLGTLTLIHHAHRVWVDVFAHSDSRENIPVPVSVKSKRKNSVFECLFCKQSPPPWQFCPVSISAAGASGEFLSTNSDGVHWQKKIIGWNRGKLSFSGRSWLRGLGRWRHTSQHHNCHCWHWQISRLRAVIMVPCLN